MWNLKSYHKILFWSLCGFFSFYQFCIFIFFVPCLSRLLVDLGRSLAWVTVLNFRSDGACCIKAFLFLDVCPDQDFSHFQWFRKKFNIFCWDSWSGLVSVWSFVNNAWKCDWDVWTRSAECVIWWWCTLNWKDIHKACALPLIKVGMIHWEKNTIAIMIWIKIIAEFLIFGKFWNTSKILPQQFFPFQCGMMCSQTVWLSLCIKHFVVVCTVFHRCGVPTLLALFEGNLPFSGGFPVQRASDVV